MCMYVRRALAYGACNACNTPKEELTKPTSLRTCTGLSSQRLCLKAQRRHIPDTASRRPRTCHAQSSAGVGVCTFVLVKQVN